MAYLPTVAWSTIASNVTLGASAYRYYITVNPLDPNEAGASPMTVAVNDWFIDFAGYPFLIEEVNGSVLTVYDILERGDGIISAYAPYANKLGYVYRPINGAIILTQAQLRKLDESAKDIIQPIEKGIQWLYRGIRLVSVEDDYTNITKLDLSKNLTYSYTENGGWQGGNSAEIDINISLGTGAKNEVAYTDNGDGTLTIQTTNFALYDNALGTGYPNIYTVNGGAVSFTDNTYNYVIVNYNSGTPILQVITDVTLINETTIIPVFSVLRRGNVLCVTNWDELGNAKVDKLHQSIVKTQRYRRESGLIISIPSTGTPRRVSLTSGTVWIGAVDISMESVISGDVGVTMFEYYKTSGTWGYSLATQLNNTYYQGTTNRVSLTANRYAVAFVYRGVDSNKHLYFVYGTGDYTLSQAQAASVPSDLPIAIRSHAILVGRVIIQKSSDTITELASAFDTVFTIQPIDNHAGLSNLGWTVSGHTATAGSVPAFNSSGVAVEASLTNGYVPYKTTNGLENSPISINGTDVTIGTLNGLLLGTSGLLSTLSSLNITYGGTGITSYTQGDLLYYSSGNSLSKLNKSTSANYYLKNSGVDNNPAWASITDADLVLSDITTNNASSSKHGFVPKLPNDTSKWFRGDGSWATISTDYGNILDSAIRMVVDNSFDPSPITTGDRYILETTSLHTNFGTITGLGVHDIVQYNGSAFIVVFDASAATSPATVTVGIDKNGASNHDWTYNVTDDIWVDRGTTTLHNSLSDLNTGVGQYYHLTSDQQSLVAGITSSYSELNYLDGTTVTSGRILFGDGIKITNDVKLFWDNVNKRLGIGTTTPEYKLSIGEKTENNYLQINSSTTGTGGLLFSAIAGNNSGALFYVHDGDYMWFRTNSAERLRITSNGNVGIGTTSPNYKLDVNGSVAISNYILLSNNDLFLGEGNVFNSDVGLYGGSDQVIASFEFAAHKYYYGNGKLVVDYANGYVGIGTTSPSYNLDVTGTGRFTSKLYLGTTTPPATDTGTLNTLVWDNTTGEVKQRSISGSLPSGVQGDILYHNGTSWVVLNAGTNGYYLKTRGSGANPIWDNPSTSTSTFLKFASYYTDVSTSGTTETTLYSITLSSGYLNTNGDTIEGKYYIFGNSITDAIINLYIFGQSISFSNVDLGSSLAILNVTIIRVSNTTIRIGTKLSYSNAPYNRQNYVEKTGLDLGEKGYDIILKGRAPTSGSLTAKEGYLLRYIT